MQRCRAAGVNARMPSSERKSGQQPGGERGMARWVAAVSESGGRTTRQCCNHGQSYPDALSALSLYL